MAESFRAGPRTRLRASEEEEERGRKARGAEGGKEEREGNLKERGSAGERGRGRRPGGPA
eukprot:2577450-Rhodomonas_salina.2